MTFKKNIGKIHLWLGLASGLVVLVSMLAASVFVWDEELTNWYYKEYVFVQPQSAPKVSLAVLLAHAQKAVPGKEVKSVEIHNDPTRAYVFGTNKRNKAPKEWTHWDDFVYWDKIYVNPYSGKVLGTVNMLTNWVDLTRRLHQNLLLRYEIGHYIVGFSTLFVLILTITGIVLWFPKNKAALKQRFTIKWNAKWRMVNYDIHNVGGFYSNILIIFLAVTGLVWTFDWGTDGIYRLLGDNPKTVFTQDEHQAPVIAKSTVNNPMDVVLAHLQTQRPDWIELSMYFINASYPDKANEISTYLRFDETGRDDSDSYYYHAQTGQLIHQVPQEQKTIGEAWRNSNYAMHVGSIYGLPTKILAGFSALFLAVLPVTGFLIWWGRRKKIRKNNP